ncbi:MAG: hypothetical protein VR75_09590 [Hyphomonadaceae bacterium BRH_c29]|nr:MAG: hypothetical protein VR75_09590 [Hyphomonadaceae bacterium BRH_c29]
MSAWSQILPFLSILPAILVIYSFFGKKSRKPGRRRLGTRGRQLLTEQIPILGHLSETQTEKLFEQVIQLRKDCAFYIGLGDPPTSSGFAKIKSDEHAIFLGQLSLLTLFRGAEFPTNVFPVAVTSDIIVQTDPIIQGSLGTVYPRTVMRNDIALNSVLNALGLSAFAFQIAKFMDHPNLSSATAEHRKEYDGFVAAIERAYQEIVVEPALAFERETGELPEAPTPFEFLLEQQQKFFGSFAEYETIPPDVRVVLDAFYGGRHQIH